MEPMKQYQHSLEKDSDIHLASFTTPPDLIKQAQEMIKDSNCVCDLKEEVEKKFKAKFEPAIEKKDIDNGISYVVSSCCVSMNDLCKCLTDTSSTMQDMQIYNGDVPNQFKIKIDSKNGLLPINQVRMCCSCPPGKCKKNQKKEFQVPEKVLKAPPRAFILRRNIYRTFFNFFKDCFAKYTKKFMNLRCSPEK